MSLGASRQRTAATVGRVAVAAAGAVVVVVVAGGAVAAAAAGVDRDSSACQEHGRSHASRRQARTRGKAMGAAPRAALACWHHRTAPGSGTAAGRCRTAAVAAGAATADKATAAPGRCGVGDEGAATASAHNQQAVATWSQRRGRTWTWEESQSPRAWYASDL